jgi:hypothetical protein
MNKTQKKWLLWFMGFAVVITLLPYLYGFWIQSDENRFSGFFIGVEDQNSYIAKMRRGYEGDWLFRTPYTTYPQNGSVTYFPYLLLGKLAGGVELFGQFLFFYQMFRIGSVCFYIFAIYKFISPFFEKNHSKKIALLLSVFGGGLGWLTFFGVNSLWQGRLPLDFYSPEAFSFIAVLTLPHNLFARAFLFLGLDCWMNQRTMKFGRVSINYMVQCAGISIFLFLFQPIALVIFFLAIGFYTVVRMIFALRAHESQISIVLPVVKLVGLVTPIIAYNVYLLFFDPFVAVWGKQNILTTAPLTDYLLAFGIFFVLALFGIKESQPFKNPVYAFFIVWIICGIGLIYLPISIQRRFIEGVWIVLVILAVKGMERIQEKRWGKMINTLILVVSCLSSFFLVLGSILQIGQKSEPIFVSKDNLQVYAYLNDTFQEGDVVFADHKMSNQIPVWTNLRTLVGLGPESIGEQDILQRYQNTLDGVISTGEWMESLRQENVKAYIIENQYKQLFSECSILFQNDRYSVCSLTYEE